MAPRDRRILFFAGLAAVASAAVVLFFFDPRQYHFYPVCVFHQITGWQCPGCGGLRATSQLLHGHLAAAWAFNPLVVLLAPIAAWFTLREAVWQCAGRVLPGSLARPAFVWAILPAFVLFAVLRNVF